MDDKKITDKGSTGRSSGYVGKYVFMAGLFWTVFIGIVLAWNIYHHKAETLEIARNHALAYFEKDVVYRGWSAGHGGVYAPITKDTPPNPHLAHLKERDITTPSGRKLTLINPAYMTRQAHELGAAKYGLHGHITSLNPIRPENAPDPWETEALEEFEKGSVEAVALDEVDGQSYIRLMKPLITKQGCLKCHAVQGYKAGDIRGGISVTVPMEPIWTIANADSKKIVSGYIAIWIFGLAGIGITGKQILHRITRHDQTQDKLNQMLGENKERVKELRCLYGVTESIRTRNTPEEIFQDVVKFIPLGWYYPDIARGKIIYDGKEYVSEPFEETEWKLSGNIVVNGEIKGSIEVYYMEERPVRDEGPFFKEELDLINGIARNVSEAIERKKYGEKLQKTLGDLERFNKLMTGREMRVIEMKKEVNALLAESGQEAKYKSVLETNN